MYKYLDELKRVWLNKTLIFTPPLKKIEAAFQEIKPKQIACSRKTHTCN